MKLPGTVSISGSPRAQISASLTPPVVSERTHGSVPILGGIVEA